MTSTILSKKPELSVYEKERLDHTPWVEKYRPKNLDDVASQDHAVKVLKNTVESSNLPHMLFYGPPGTGKTSTILALAKQLYGPSLYKSRVLELNASDERGISIVRQKIKNFARLAVSNPTTEDLENYPCPPYKIIILDEADSMTTDAQSALRRTMENYSSVTRFCLVCNYITRIIDPLASRCSKFRFKLLNNDSALDRLKHIVAEEEIKLEDEKSVLEEVLKVANGDLRKAITYLQSASKLHNSLNSMHSEGEVMSEPNILEGGIGIDSIKEIAGIAPDSVIEAITKSAETRNRVKILDEVKAVIFQGWSAQQILNQLHDYYILNEEINPLTKSKISNILFDTDMKLTNGTDEHIQMLNLVLQISKVL